MSKFKSRIILYIRDHKKPVTEGSLVNRFGWEAEPALKDLKEDGFVVLKSEPSGKRLRLTKKGLLEYGEYRYELFLNRRSFWGGFFSALGVELVIAALYYLLGRFS